jgi:hypothetical protein
MSRNRQAPTAALMREIREQVSEAEQGITVEQREERVREAVSNNPILMRLWEQAIVVQRPAQLRLESQQDCTDIRS